MFSQALEGQVNEDDEGLVDSALSNEDAKFVKIVSSDALKNADDLVPEGGEGALLATLRGAPGAPAITTRDTVKAVQTMVATSDEAKVVITPERKRSGSAHEEPRLFFITLVGLATLLLVANK